MTVALDVTTTKRPVSLPVSIKKAALSGGEKYPL